jgi:hypothetical protein
MASAALPAVSSAADDAGASGVVEAAGVAGVAVETWDCPVSALPATLSTGRFSATFFSGSADGPLVCSFGFTGRVGSVPGAFAAGRSVPVACVEDAVFSDGATAGDFSLNPGGYMAAAFDVKSDLEAAVAGEFWALFFSAAGTGVFGRAGCGFSGIGPGDGTAPAAPEVGAGTGEAAPVLPPGVALTGDAPAPPGPGPMGPLG